MNPIAAPWLLAGWQTARRLRKGFALSLLLGGLSVSVAGAQAPAAPTTPPPATPPAESVDPAVNTSSTAAPAVRPATRPAAASSPRASGGRRAMDRVDLDASQITGNRELPRVLYIVPWKRSDLGDLTGKPVNSLLDEVLAPVDRDVFRRETRYFDALATGPARPPAGAPAPTGPTMPPAPAAPSGAGDSVRDGSQPVEPPGT